MAHRYYQLWDFLVIPAKQVLLAAPVAKGRFMQMAKYVVEVLAPPVTRHASAQFVLNIVEKV